MKHLYVLLSFISLLFGCNSKNKGTAPVGPLSKIKEYQVIPVFSSSTTAEKINLRNHLIEALEKLGTVQIADKCISDAPDSWAGFVISADDGEHYKSGMIKIIAEGEIIINKHKTSCDVWTTNFLDPTGAYPIDTGNGIAFQREETAKSPDIKEVVTQMLSQFAEQYHKDNPDLKPIFYIYDLKL